MTSLIPEFHGSEMFFSKTLSSFLPDLQPRNGNVRPLGSCQPLGPVVVLIVEQNVCSNLSCGNLAPLK